METSKFIEISLRDEWRLLGNFKLSFSGWDFWYDEKIIFRRNFNKNIF